VQTVRIGNAVAPSSTASPVDDETSLSGFLRVLNNNHHLAHCSPCSAHLWDSDGVSLGFGKTDGAVKSRSVRRLLGPIALVLAIAGYGVVRSPTDVAAATRDQAPAPAPPDQDAAKPIPPAADAQPPQPSSGTTGAAPTAAPASAETLCKKLGSAALENGLPTEFFARLIWQESRFDTRSVSPKGARGIAQFMPETARSRGLADPFEPGQALRHSARWLKELREQFGNLGLAAAAYNSGPRRVQDWLHGRGKLPGETRDYVKIITGRTVEEWVKLRTNVGAQSVTAGSAVPCHEVVTAMAHDPSPVLEQGAAKVSSNDIETALAQDPSPPPEQGAAKASKNDIATVSAHGPYPPAKKRAAKAAKKDAATVAARDSYPPPEKGAAEGPKNDIVRVAARDPYPPPEQGAAEAPRDDIVTVAARDPYPLPEQGADAIASAASASGRWGLQLIGNWSEDRALAEYRDLQQKFPDILGDRPPLVVRGTMAGRGSASWYRIRVAESTRERADELCARLERAGGVCSVLKN